jgi:hypothetical protein
MSGSSADDQLIARVAKPRCEYFVRVLAGRLKIVNGQCPLLAQSRHAEKRNQCRYWGKSDMTFCTAYVRF